MIKQDSDLIKSILISSEDTDFLFPYVSPVHMKKTISEILQKTNIDLKPSEIDNICNTCIDHNWQPIQSEHLKHIKIGDCLRYIEFYNNVLFVETSIDYYDHNIKNSSIKKCMNGYVIRLENNQVTLKQGRLVWNVLLSNKLWFYKFSKLHQKKHLFKNAIR